jgi:sterol desaturase/sphingolipid hydroxylase (fatty acid hydroxylase superfamily)
VKVPITKHKLAINFGMLALALGIIANAILMVIMMIHSGVQTRFVIGFAFSFIGLFVYGFHFFWFGHRVFYYKKVKKTIDLSDISFKNQSQEEEESSGVFVTEEGKLLY